MASNPPSSSCSAASNLRAASSPSPTPPPSPVRSRSPRTPRTPRGRTSRVPQLGRIPSPERDRPPAGSPRAARVDTPPRSRRQYHCRNQGCSEVFRIVRWRNNHETNTCRFRAQSQVVLPLYYVIGQLNGSLDCLNLKVFATLLFLRFPVLQVLSELLTESQHIMSFRCRTPTAEFAAEALGGLNIGEGMS